MAEVCAIFHRVAVFFTATSALCVKKTPQRGENRNEFLLSRIKPLPLPPEFKQNIDVRNCRNSRTAI
jgi:hypothetical protein